MQNHPQVAISRIESAAPGSGIDGYAGKPSAYFAGARADFVDAMTTDNKSWVLEVGCGSGETGALAKSRGKAGHYVGIELFPAAGARAGRVLEQVLIADVEKLELPWPDATFDAVVLSEVLEHLVEPWALLSRLARVVKPGGMVFASSPNVSHWRVVRELVAGRFELTDRGVFDRTHMRWFTPSTFRAMFERAGFSVERLGPVTPFSARTRALSRLTGGRIDHLFTAQICVHARRRP